MQAITQSKARSYWQVVVGVLLGLSLGGCNQVDTNRISEGVDNQPRVVATSTIITDLAQRVGGEEIQLTGILQPGVDPHVYEPTPADSRTLETADLILYNGYDLEPGLINLMNAAGKQARRVAVGEAVEPLQLEEDGETVPDPHVWGSAENAIAMVNLIRDELIKLSPTEAEIFTQRAAKLTSELQQLHNWINQQIQTIPPAQRQLVTTHDAFQYYAEAYGIAIAGTLIGISTEEQPSAQTVTRLVEAIRKTNVPAIFAETTVNPALITTVAQEAGVKLAPRELYSDSIGEQGSEADSYIKMMVANTRTIVEALGGQYTPFEFSK
jgi:manganese/iron transport system substrate-binding protein